MSLQQQVYPETAIPRRENIIALFDSIQGITPLQKRLLKERYAGLFTDFQRRSKRFTALYYSLRIIVTVGSLLVPAFLSIQYTTLGNAEQTIYWITWLLSLAVTTSNGVYTLFKVDKKYYYLVTAFELLKSEAWQYLELTGKYASKINGPVSTHANQYIFFSHALEKHKLKQVEEEYYKFYDHGAAEQEKTTNVSISQQNITSQHDTLIPPTPDKSLIEISKSISPDTMNTVNSILSSLGKTASPESVISRIHAAVRRASIDMSSQIDEPAGHGFVSQSDQEI